MIYLDGISISLLTFKSFGFVLFCKGTPPEEGKPLLQDQTKTKAKNFVSRERWTIHFIRDRRLPITSID